MEFGYFKERHMKFERLMLMVAAVSFAASPIMKGQTASQAAATSIEGRSMERRLANVEAKVEHLLSQLTLDEKLSLVHANAKFSIASVERLGIHEMWMSDGPHGVRQEISRHSWNSAGWSDDQATYLPHLTTVAATWDPEMAALHGDVLGSEARHRRKDFILGPGVNLARLPLYGRNFEYMGEDPYLAARMAVAEIKAIQKNDVAATIKHFALNTQELNRIGVDARPDERTLREVYLPVFEAAVKEADVQGVMGAYNRFHGTNVNQSKHLVLDILKGEWGFQGVLLTDWNVDINTYDAAMNGLDIEMGTAVESYDDYFLADPLRNMINAGKVPLAVLDDKVRRILRVQLRIGMMDKHRLSGERNTPAHQQAARKIAAAGVVLLKNDRKVLPLDKTGLKKVLVIGPNADKQHGSGGGSSEVKALYEITPLQGLREKLGDDVEITVMRARSSSLAPIAGDYIASRHWTGTPAWTMTQYSDKSRATALRATSIPDSYYRTGGAEAEHVTFTGAVKPLQSGIHTLKLSVVGAGELIVDGVTVMTHSSRTGEIFSADIDLHSEKSYAFEIRYDGRGTFTLGWDAPGNLFSPEKAYLAAARKADAVIYFGGLSHADDRESFDRRDMKLPGSQDEIISKLLAINKNTIVFLVAGSAVEMPWVEQAGTIVWGWYGGMEAGRAFADVLFGDVNPGGKMPITLPAALEDTAPIMLNDYNEQECRYPEGVFIGYRWFEAKGIKPLFPFGHGLSYTRFEYSNLRLSSRSIRGDEALTVTATIGNTGDVAGAEVVQLYLHDKAASVERPVKELKGFAKVFLAPGESKDVTLVLHKRDLSFWDVTRNDWRAEPGEFEVMLGASVSDIRLQMDFAYQNP